MPRDVSICALFYGDYPALAERCLEGIERHGDFERIRDVRLGLNEASPQVERLAHDFCRRIAVKAPVALHECRENAFKYPMMRRMLRARPLAKWTMWFDDDSCLVECPNWWRMLDERLSSPAIVGQIWSMRLQGGQAAWIGSQPWFAGRDIPQLVKFVTGGWWVAPSDWLLAHDWPVRELRHRGGDVMLGVLAHQQQMPLLHFDAGVWINADLSGVHNKSKRRGFDEKPCGADYVGQALDISHQEFGCTVSHFDGGGPILSPTSPSQPFFRLP